jgi:integral membrane sensor domain MASE1
MRIAVATKVQGRGVSLRPPDIGAIILNDFWSTHWWLIIILLAMLFPISGMIMGAWAQNAYFRQRREALETLKIYANQGKEPPPEVVDALTGWGWGGRRWRGRWRDAAAASNGAVGQGDWFEARTAYLAARAARWRAREPFRRWNNAITVSAFAGGLYWASRTIHDPVIADRFLVGAIIIGALAAAAIVSALLVTLFRPQ